MTVSKKYKQYFLSEIDSKTKKLINNFKYKHYKEETSCASRKASEKSLEILRKILQNTKTY